ncbi:stage II sporulation protein D [Paenibacillus sp. ACRRX]|uniref:stage II sporulation protein D n=1 Tax=Paenibacillus sp. ACRRX TaxID=2918206 RepID=UPI001EF666E8|nr:stage II sporulation protein D [Paenibacillus sp. ACRRX]MCG7408019.1 stage II sporulation protein D [Paenibacillus sp. ACRRX]
MEDEQIIEGGRRKEQEHSQRGYTNRGRHRRQMKETRFSRGWFHLAMWSGLLMTFAILAPLLLVSKGHQQQAVPSPQGGKAAVSLAAEPADAPPYVRVYVSATRKVERIALERYVRGVVAAEMPERFELEALKAQAIAARTYIVRRLARGDVGGAAGGADVTDTVAHQAYVPLAKLTERQHDAIAKLNRAVNDTAGLVLTYKDKPIEATFFSTSNGYTENVEDYWNQKLPYLRSVSSPWDKKLSPRFMTTVRMEADDFLQKLGVSVNAVPALKAAISNRDKGVESPDSLSSAIELLSVTKGKRIGEVQVGTHTFSGREFREKLGLSSSAISWKMENGKIVLTTYGYGHGVGMSQYGAQGMALEGASAERILTYYYQGVKLTPVSRVLEKIDTAYAKR